MCVCEGGIWGMWGGLGGGGGGLGFAHAGEERETKHVFLSFGARFILFDNEYKLKKKRWVSGG